MTKQDKRLKQLPARMRKLESRIKLMELQTSIHLLTLRSAQISIPAYTAMQIKELMKLQRDINK